jgi:hypothetical protein
VVTGVQTCALPISLWVYPVHYAEFESGQAAPVIIVAVRNFALLVLAVIVALPARFWPGRVVVRNTTDAKYYQ